MGPTPNDLKRCISIFDLEPKPEKRLRNRVRHHWHLKA